MRRSHEAWRWIVAKRTGLIEFNGDIGLAKLAIFSLIINLLIS